MNWLSLIIVGVLAIALIVFLIVRNQKDEKQLKKQLNDDYSTRKSEDDDPDLMPWYSKILTQYHSMILTINGGSSSIKFSLYEIKDVPEKLAFGVIENIGTDKAEFTYTKDNQEKKSSLTEAKNHDQAANFLIKWLEKE